MKQQEYDAALEKRREQYSKTEFEIYKRSDRTFEDIVKSEMKRTRRDLFTSTENIRVAVRKLEKKYHIAISCMWVSAAINALLFLWMTVQMAGMK